MIKAGRWFCVKVGRLVQKENSGSSPVCLLWVGPAWGSGFLFFPFVCIPAVSFSLLTVAKYFFSCLSAASLLPSVWGSFTKNFFWIEYLRSRQITLIFELTYLKTKKRENQSLENIEKINRMRSNGMSPGIREASRSLSLPQPRNNSPDLWSHKVTLRGPWLQGWNAQQTETFTKRSSPNELPPLTPWLPFASKAEGDPGVRLFGDDWKFVPKYIMCEIHNQLVFLDLIELCQGIGQEWLTIYLCHMWKGFCSHSVRKCVREQRIRNGMAFRQAMEMACRQACFFVRGNKRGWVWGFVCWYLLHRSKDTFCGAMCLFLHVQEQEGGLQT